MTDTQKNLRTKIREMLLGDPEMRTLGYQLQIEEQYKDNCHLPLLQKLIGKNENVIVTGSTALLLHGIKLNRLYRTPGDLDIAIPYFKRMDFNLISSDVPMEKKVEGYSDFQYYARYEGVNMDILIDPLHEYVERTLDDFKYRVSPLPNIWGAKIRYIISKRDGWEKHNNDLLEAMNILPAPPTVSYACSGS